MNHDVSNANSKLFYWAKFNEKNKYKKWIFTQSIENRCADYK